MPRMLKQLLIAAVYFGVFLLLVWPLYRAVVPAATCTDGIQNQGEEGLDCGAVCGKSCPPPVVALSTQNPAILVAGADSYDVVATIDNPNGRYGAARVPYILLVNGSAVRSGVTYVNPAQSRHLLFSLHSLASAPTTVVLQVDQSQVQWSELQIDSAGAVAFAARDEQLTPSASSMRYTANVTNRSTFDFDTVDVAVLLYDAGNQLVAAGTTVMRTLTASQTRGITIEWPFAVAGAVRAEIIVSTNVFDNENFIRTHGVPERFQEN